MTRAALHALLLATTTCVPLYALAQPAAAPAAQPGAADAVRVLLDQAAYWRAQSQNAQADLAISRVLELDPNNAEALSMQAQTAAEAGKTGAAGGGAGAAEGGATRMTRASRGSSRRSRAGRSIRR